MALSQLRSTFFLALLHRITSRPLLISGAKWPLRDTARFDFCEGKDLPQWQSEIHLLRCDADLAWTLCTAGLIGLVSVVSIIVFRAPSREVAKVIPAAQETGVAETTATENRAAESKEQPRPAADGSSTPRPSIQRSTEMFYLPAPCCRATRSRVQSQRGIFIRRRYGYSVSLAGTSWVRWENLAEVVPEAEWGALLHDYGRFLVIPIALADLDPRPEALDHALLARLGISYPSQQLTDFKTLEHSGAVGHSFRLSREVNGATNIYRLWILRHGSFAYLAAAWLDASVGKAASIDPTPRELDDALAAISFDVPPPALIDPQSFNRSERQTHSTIYNNLGLFAFNSHDYAEAKSCFRRAFEIEPTDASILLNLANADIELKQYARCARGARAVLATIFKSARSLGVSRVSAV